MNPNSQTVDVDWLANVIRTNSGDHLNPLGAGALAEKIIEAMASLPSGPADAAHGRLIEMGDLTTSDLDGTLHKQPMALLIRFDSVEAIRKALAEDRCTFSFGEPSPDATDSTGGSNG